MPQVPLLLLIILLTGCTVASSKIPDATAASNKAVIFDIDGTLTPSVFSIWTARKNAADSVHLMEEKGYKIIYLSARSIFFQKNIPRWLVKNKFPDGFIHVPKTYDENKHPAEFKEGILKAYEQKGWNFEYAFGDSATDFDAYKAAGIAKDHVFALRRKDEKECEAGAWNTCLTNWNEFLQLNQTE